MTPIVAISPEDLEALLRRLIRDAVRDAMSGNVPLDTLSTEQAARAANVSAKTVREWIASGALPAGRRGRLRTVRREDLERYLAGERGPATRLESLRASLGRRSG